jgi:hypothetical protein
MEKSERVTQENPNNEHKKSLQRKRSRIMFTTASREYVYKRMADSGFNLSRTVNIIIEEAAAEAERSN